MSVLGMSLNLPEDIESDAEDIRTGVDELFVLRDTMLGHAGDADASLQNAADEFVGTLSWDISEASQQDLDSWQNLAELLTGTGLALGFFADAVDDHREAREGCESRWEEYKIFAQARIDDDEGGLNFNGMRQKDAEIEHLITIRSTLLREHEEARDLFDEATDEVEGVLVNGPNQDVWERAFQEGLLSGRDIHVLGGDAPPEIEFAPEDDWSAEEVTAWWHGLAPNQQDWAMEEFSDDLRNLDGVPVAVRDELNRDYLEIQIENLSTPGIPPNPYLLAQMREVEDALEGDDKFLIFYDPWATGGGQAAISTGDPDLADNVSTMVPGMFNHMGTIASPMERSEEFYEQMNENDPDSDHASIVWMGYNTPPDGEWDPQGPAEDLVAFQEGLRSTHQGDSPSHNTVLGHSFGAYVAGAADNPDIGGGLGADSLVLIGGPGSSVDHVTEFSTDVDDVHIVVGDDDWINWVRDFPADLSIDERFGRPMHHDRFYLDPEDRETFLGNRLNPWEDTDHSDYFVDEETLDCLGDVLTGEKPE